MNLAAAALALVMVLALIFHVARGEMNRLAPSGATARAGGTVFV